MIETYAAFALIGPTFLSVGIAWLFIRQGKASMGVFTGLISVTISIINYIDIKPYFDALSIPIIAVKYYASLAGIILGVVLIVFASARALQHHARQTIRSI